MLQTLLLKNTRNGWKVNIIKLQDNHYNLIRLIVLKENAIKLLKYIYNGKSLIYNLLTKEKRKGSTQK